MLGWLKDKLEEKRYYKLVRRREENYMEKIRDFCASRFVPYVFIVPYRYDELGPDFKEIGLEYIERTMDHYREPPRTQREVIENEKKFWNLQAKHCSHTKPEDPEMGELIPHAEILTYYKTDEKYLLREYYAATGKIIDPLIKEYCRLLDKKKDIGKDEKHSIVDPDYVTAGIDKRNDNKAAKRARVRDELEHFRHVTAPTHWERWGEWFVSHVAEAYRQATEKPAPATNVYGKGGFATLDDINRAQGRQGQPERRAQSQTFKD